MKRLRAAACETGEGNAARVAAWARNGIVVLNFSRSSRLATEAFMDQHLEQGLVSHSLAGRDFSGLRYVGFGQS